MDTTGIFIAVGSVKHGQGITSLVYNLGYNLSRYTDLNVIMFDMNFIFGEMNYLIDPKTNNSIDDLISLAKNQELTGERLFENTEVLRSNLRLVNPSRINSTDYLKQNSEHVLNIIQAARKAFDVVIVDTVAGSQSPVSRMVYSNCDVFVNVMTQNPYILEWYKAYNTQKEIKEINIINMFEEDIYPDTGEIEKEFGIDHMTLRYSKQMKNYYNQKDIQAFTGIEDAYNCDMHNLIKRIFTFLGRDIEMKFGHVCCTKNSTPKGFLCRLLNKG